MGRTAGDMALNHPGSFFTGPNTQSINDLISPFMNPYMDQVVGGINQQFDRSRGQAVRQGSQAATSAGAFNSSRHGIAEGTRLGEIDAAEANQVGGFLSGQFNNAMNQGLGYNRYQNSLLQQQLQEPLFRAQQAQGFQQGSLGPTGQTNTATQQGSFLGDLAGLGMMGLGAFTGGGTPTGFTGGFTGGGFNPGGPLFPGGQGVGLRSNNTSGIGFNAPNPIYNPFGR